MAREIATAVSRLVPDEDVSEYVSALADLDPALVERAVEGAMGTTPSPSELRTLCDELRLVVVNEMIAAAVFGHKDVAETIRADHPNIFFQEVPTPDERLVRAEGRYADAVNVARMGRVELPTHPAKRGTDPCRVAPNMADVEVARRDLAEAHEGDEAGEIEWAKCVLEESLVYAANSIMNHVALRKAERVAERDALRATWKTTRDASSTPTSTAARRRASVVRPQAREVRARSRALPARGSPSSSDGANDDPHDDVDGVDGVLLEQARRVP
jgi:hypothetical protein